MAKGYVIEEIRASVRLRDPASGSRIEVPLALGDHWTPPAAPTSPDGVHLEDASTAEHHTPEQPEPQPETVRRKRGRPRKSAEPESTAAKSSDEPAANSSAAKSDEQPARKPRSDKHRTKGRKPGHKGDATEKHPDADTLATPQGRARQVDPQSLSSEDANAWAKLQANLRHVRGRKGGKVGGLGWEETTDAGRSGLLARFGGGAYKILHAGADTYALFYEWDNGKYERLGCGNAEELMNLATERARSGPPEPPPTNLGLELARLYCGNAQQKAAAAERLEPAFREVDVDAPKERGTPTPAREEPGAQQPEIVIDAKMDQQLAESLKRALEEMEG